MKNIKLSKYDNKCVRIVDNFDYVFEGNAVYNSKEYNYHELGVNEDGLQILNFIFYKSIIKKIDILENGFTDKYGIIEKEIVSDGIEDVLDAFDYEDNDHICRLIRCVKDNNFDKDNIKRIKDYLRYNDDKRVIEELKNI